MKSSFAAKILMSNDEEIQLAVKFFFYFYFFLNKILKIVP